MKLSVAAVYTSEQHTFNSLHFLLKLSTHAHVFSRSKRSAQERISEMEAKLLETIQEFEDKLSEAALDKAHATEELYNTVALVSASAVTSAKDAGEKLEVLKARNQIL
jgi:hypothetical protein